MKNFDNAGCLVRPEISQTGEKSDVVHPCIIIIMKLRAVIHLLHAFRKDGVLNANFSKYAARFLAVRAPQVLMVCCSYLKHCSFTEINYFIHTCCGLSSQEGCAKGQRNSSHFS